MNAEWPDRLKNYFGRRRQNYQRTFPKTAPFAMEVLADLEEFCCADRTTAISNDPIAIAVREGRRQVWLRIVRAIHLTPEEQVALVRMKDKP